MPSSGKGPTTGPAKVPTRSPGNVPNVTTCGALEASCGKDFKTCINFKNLSAFTGWAPRR